MVYYTNKISVDRPIKNKPNLPFSYRKLWQAVLTHRPAEAIAICARQADLDCQADPVVSRLTQGLLRPPLLLEILQELAETEQRSEGWRSLFFGLARLILGQGSSALKFFEKAFQVESCKIAALVHMAGFYLARHDRKIVEKMLNEGLSLSDQVGELHLLKARLFLLDKSIDQAREQVEAAIKAGCYSPLNLARFRLELLMAQDEQEAAIECAVNLLANGMEGVAREGVATAGLGVLTACGGLDEADNYLNQALENDPQNVILLTHRADIAAMRGRFRVAATAIQRVLAQDGENIELLHKKACLAGQGFSYEQALEALDKVLVLAQDLPPPIRAVYMSGYGDIYFDQDKPDEAKNAYREALIVDGECLPALSGLSRVLTSKGRMDEARKLQDAVFRIAPVRGVQMMIHTDRIPENEREIQYLKKMAERQGGPLQVRATLNFSLAKFWQKRGMHDTAMTFADRANELTRTYVSYDHQQTARKADRMIAKMSKDFFDNRQGYGTDCDLPVYILGMPRSGTTLVEQIVGSHSKVFPGGELGVIPTMWSRLMVWENRLGSEFQHIPDCAMELSPFLSRQFAQKLEGEYRELMHEGASQVHITDKLPHNFKSIGLIKLLFPKARIIYCRRSPGGIALSNFFTDYKARHGVMGYAYHKEWIGFEIANCQRLMAHWTDLFGRDIHIIDYEELVENPEPVVQALLQYLGLEWEDRVMEFHSLDRSVRTASMTQVRQPMYTSSKERWRQYENALQPMFSALEARNAQPLPNPAPLSAHEPGLFLRGMDLLQSEKSEEAKAVFKAILSVYPRHAAATHMLGAAFAKQGIVLSACEYMKQSIKLHPNNPTWYGNLAIVLEHLQQPEEARQIRQKGERISMRNAYLSGAQFSY